MATSIEDLAARVERLERRLQERSMQRTPASDAPDPLVRRIWSSIPFSAWLKISGPTFAVMALGFGVLWNAQQATTQRILDVQESTTARILEVQNRILELQESTTDRLLDMQQQILEMQREERAGRG
jgi:hypothetical protein